MALRINWQFKRYLIILYEQVSIMRMIHEMANGKNGKEHDE